MSDSSTNFGGASHLFCKVQFKSRVKAIENIREYIMCEPPGQTRDRQNWVAMGD